MNMCSEKKILASRFAQIQPHEAAQRKMHVIVHVSTWLCTEMNVW